LARSSNFAEFANLLTARNYIGGKKAVNIEILGASAAAIRT
jgi:hypothetical protein